LIAFASSPLPNQASRLDAEARITERGLSAVALAKAEAVGGKL
jgi:hypothetical protein